MADLDAEVCAVEVYEAGFARCFDAEIMPEAVEIVFYMRAWDSGTGGWVVWTSNDSPDISPIAARTTPNYTGTLSAVHVELSI